MQKEYDLTKLVKRKKKVKAHARAAKVAISLRLDGGVLAALKSEAMELGLPYQTHISSILYQFISGDLMLKKKSYLNIKNKKKTPKSRTKFNSRARV